MGERNVPANKGWARFAGVLLLGQGLASIASFIGLVDIVLGVGLLRLKERARDTAVVLSIVQLILMVAIFIFFAVMSAAEPLIGAFLVRYVVVIPFLVPFKLATIIILTRKSVRAACG